MKEKNNRRDFIKKASVLGVLSIGFSDIVNAAHTPSKKDLIHLKKDDTILFQGDSITDSYRNRNEKGFNVAPALGTGYAFLSSSELLFRQADKNLRIYNRGVSGHKTFDLNNRWKEDCIDLKPNVLSILVGVNDFWVPQNGVRGTVGDFKDSYRVLLDKTKTNLPNTKLIVGEPFGLSGIKGSKHEVWPDGFEEYQHVALELSKEFDAVFIPYQKVFNEALKKAPIVYWTRDGVHPTIAGSRLMAEAWLSIIKK